MINEFATRVVDRCCILPDFGLHILAADPSAQNVNEIDQQQSMEPSISILIETEVKLTSRTKWWWENCFCLSYRWWNPPLHRLGNVCDHWSLSIYRHESTDSFFGPMDDLCKIPHRQWQTKILFSFRYSSDPSVKSEAGNGNDQWVQNDACKYGWMSATYKIEMNFQRRCHTRFAQIPILRWMIFVQ